MAVMQSPVKDVRSPNSSGADRCAQEPIHIIAHAQSYGFLIAASESDFIVRHVSTNVTELLDRSLTGIVGHPLEDVLDAHDAAALKLRATTDDLLALNPLRVRIGRPARELDCIAHRHAGMLLLEFESAEGAHSLRPLRIATQVQGPLRRMGCETTIEGLAHVAAAEVRRASAFDRVIVYRFDPDWNGRVIADVGDAFPSYLGHQFPASDIPAQARELFLVNTLRSIADATSQPVPIVPAVDPQNGRPLDLTRSLLRSASPTHTRYVRNMGVTATMTVSIIVAGRLWGMVTAHHRSPHRLDYAARSVCDLLGQILAAQISALTDSALFRERLETRAAIDRYITVLQHAPSTTEGPSLEPARLLELLHADALLARVDDNAFAFGTNLDEDRLRRAIAGLREKASDGIASSNLLVEIDPSAAAYAAEASGALYIALGDSGDYILLLRHELVETIVWAGNPYKSATVVNSGALHPRKSFESWKETIRGHSERWTALELTSARTLREELLLLRAEQQRHRAEEHVRYLAHFDVLTGLPNRNSVGEFLERSLRDAEAQSEELAVLFIDLDGFKRFNDTLGHDAGDRILQIAATRMREVLRDGDFVGRLGGDEFVAILPRLKGERQALAASQRLREAIADPFELAHGQIERITASIGISCYPDDGSTAAELMKSSDTEMYRAKLGGSHRMDSAI
jgi:chemotaxis family two-component system sensor kinase Cph1